MSICCVLHNISEINKEHFLSERNKSPWAGLESLNGVHKHMDIKPSVKQFCPWCWLVVLKRRLLQPTVKFSGKNDFVHSYTHVQRGQCACIIIAFHLQLCHNVHDDCVSVQKSISDSGKAPKVLWHHTSLSPSNESSNNNLWKVSTSSTSPDVLLDVLEDVSLICVGDIVFLHPVWRWAEWGDKKKML